MADPQLRIQVVSDATSAAAGLDKVAGSVDQVAAASKAASSQLDGATSALKAYGNAADDAASSARGAGEAVDSFGGGVGDVSSALSGIGPAVEAAGFPGLAGSIDTATVALDAVEGATMLFTTAQSVANVAMNSGKVAAVASWPSPRSV